MVDGDEDKSYMPHESYCFAGVELGLEMMKSYFEVAVLGFFFL